jgi:hypothetical protein
MNILEASPGSGIVAHVAAVALLYLHIGAGTVSLLVGTGALVAKKGSRWHRLAGKVFVISMLIMTVIGACVAPFLPTPERATMLAGVMTFYLVLTGFTALSRTGQRQLVTDSATLMVSIGLLGVAWGLLHMASTSSTTGTLDGQPPQSFYMFVIIGTFAVIGDAAIVFKGGHQGGIRLARHIWRMCAALFVAAGSLFLGQQQLFPASLRDSIWLLLPEVAVLLAMLYWLGHTFVSRFWSKRKRVLPLAAAPR